MISLLRRYRKSLFVGIITVFLIGIFVGLGGYLFTSRDVSLAVATVGRVKIPYQLFLVRLNRTLDALRGRGTDLSDEEVREIKQAMLRDMIVDELLAERAEEMGLVVTDEDVARDIRGTPAFQQDGVFRQDLYFQAIRSQLRETPEGYEAQRRRALAAVKLKQLIYHRAKLTPQELREAYAQDHKGSLKDFEKEKEAFGARVQQQRALDLINYYLRQLSTQVEIRSYLEQRETGT